MEIRPLLRVPPPHDPSEPPRPVPSARALWLAEGAATFLLLLSMTVLFRYLMHPDSWLAQHVPSPSTRLLVDALVSGATVTLLIVSPLGRISGAHMNPAVTVMLWAAGACPSARLPLYLSAQLTGSLLGTAAGRTLLGEPLAHPDVRHALLQSAAGQSPFVTGLGEAVGTAALLSVVLHLTLSPHLEEVAACAVGTTLSVLIILIAPLTGGSLNPARQWGPWLMTGTSGPVWPYIAGPILAALVVGAPARLLSGRGNPPATP